MIRILDNDALIFVRAHNLRITRQFQCHVPDQIREEFLGDRKNDEWLNTCDFIAPEIELGSYLRAFASIINRYPHVSFYSLKGLGDVAILASAAVLLRGNGSAPTLFRDPVCVVSRDRGLRTFATDEFSEDFTLETPEQFADLLAS